MNREMWLSSVVLLTVASPALSQTYEISWWSVDAGGAMASAGGSFVLDATSGQHDAGGPFVGSPYVLHGGFWALAAGGAGGPQADLVLTKTDGQTSAIPGLPVTYTLVAGNPAGPDPVSGATLSDPIPPQLLNATWTCTAAGGATCTASGAGSIDDSVALPVGGTATYTLTATVDPGAFGSLVNTGILSPPSGVSDPNPGNNTATDTDNLLPQADVSATKTDGQTTVLPGAPVTYTMTMSNSGPSVSGGAIVTDAVPASLLGPTWTCTASAGSTCTAAGSGSINDNIDLMVGGTATYTLTGTLDPAATGTLVNTVSITDLTDPNPADNSATDTDTILVGVFVEGELSHGYRALQDLAAEPGPVADSDLFRILQQAHASYEVLVDGISGDIGSGSGPLLERLASDATTVLQVSGTPGAGGSRNLLFMNSLDMPVSDQYVRVQSAGCTTGCDAADVYRLSAWETTGLVPRFNNSGTQTTVLVLQNSGDIAMDVDIRFWDATGVSLGGPPIQTLGPHQGYVLNTSTVAPGSSGSIRVANTGRYGQLVGKAVAVEPATGFTFDTALSCRPY